MSELKAFRCVFHNKKYSILLVNASGGDVLLCIMPIKSRISFNMKFTAMNTGEIICSRLSALDQDLIAFAESFEFYTDCLDIAKATLEGEDTL